MDLGTMDNIYKNQVGEALDATDAAAHLLSRVMRNCFFYQGEPNKNRETGEYHTTHNQSWSRSSCQLHTNSNFLVRSVISRRFCSNLPIADNSEENKQLVRYPLSNNDGIWNSHVESLPLSISGTWHSIMREATSLPPPRQDT